MSFLPQSFARLIFADLIAAVLIGRGVVRLVYYAYSSETLKSSNSAARITAAGYTISAVM